MKVNKVITKEDLKNGYKFNLTVGKLKDFLSKHEIPDSSKVLVERVENKYFENHNWGVYLKDNENTLKNTNGESVKETQSQYIPSWCCVRYEDEKDTLFIDLHY